MGGAVSSPKIIDYNARNWFFSELPGLPPLPGEEKPELQEKLAPFPAKEKGELKIIHFNDTYNLEKDKEGNFGLARFATKLQSIVSSGGDHPPLLLFSGDCLGPSKISTVTKGEHMLKALDKLGVVASVLGNHELDFGLENFVALSSKGNFPWLCSNCWHNDTGEPLAGCEEAMVLTIQGFRVGLIGLIQESWLHTTVAIDREVVDYADFVSVGRHYATKLKLEEKCDIVVALTHMDETNDQRLAKECPEIDLILGGHDHAYLTGTLEPHGIQYAKSGHDFKTLSTVVIAAQGEDARCSVTIEKFDVDNSVEENAEMKAFVDSYTDLFAQQAKKVLGDVVVPLDARESTLRFGESNVGNWLTDLMRRSVPHMPDKTPNGCEIALLNSGSIRAAREIPSGPFTLEDLYGLLPFESDTVVKQCTGETILSLMEDSVSMLPKENGLFLQVSGLSYEYDANKQAGSRVVQESVKVGDELLDPTRLYSVVGLTYLEVAFKRFAESATIVTAEESPELKTIVVNAADAAFATLTAKRATEQCSEARAAVTGAGGNGASAVLTRFKKKARFVSAITEGHAAVITDKARTIDEGMMKIAPLLENRISSVKSSSSSNST